MSPGLRRSPLHDLLVQASLRQTSLHGMPTSAELQGDEASLPIMLTDVSCLPRMGVKGPQAEAWLRGQRIGAPEGVNAWTRTADGVLVARLGRSEFFVEDCLGGAAVERARTMLAPGPGLYPVLRQDAALALAGQRLNDLLVQTCSVDFKSQAAHKPLVIMTSMIGVSVLALWDRHPGGAGATNLVRRDVRSVSVGDAPRHRSRRGRRGGRTGKLFPDGPGLSMVQERGRP